MKLSISQVITPLALACVLAQSGLADDDAQPKTGDPGATFHRYEAGEFKGMPYRWMKPIDYDSQQAYPLILSLHGRAGVGADNRKNLRLWNTAVLNQDDWRRKYPCFVIAPQNTFAWVRPKTVKAKVASPDGQEFLAGLNERSRRFVDKQISMPDESSLEIVFGLIKHLQAEYNIDSRRIYVLGGSMGGFGAWAAMQEEPELFAAGIPVCGGPYVYLDLARIKHVPVWAFHGVNDGTVPYALSRNAFESLKREQGNCKLTSLAGVGHGAPGTAFRYTGDDAAKGFVTEYSGQQCDRESDVWKWLFRQRKN